MTTPQPAPGQPPPTTDTGQDALLVTAIATALATALTAEAAWRMLKRRSFPTTPGLPSAALLAALQVVMAFPPSMTGTRASASFITSRTNQLRRAQFALAAARRIGSDLVEARSRNRSLRDQLAASITRERRYFSAHMSAQWNREQAAARVDDAESAYGSLLGWNSVNDARTSAECRAADGKNFWADQPPLIGYPGMVHPSCRCYPGAPHPDGRMLPTAGRPRQRVPDYQPA